MLQREPFGEILENTLSKYWSIEDRADAHVRWRHAEKGDQVWRGNTYLNFFCVEGVDPLCFEVIEQEFGHSIKLWRRMLQSGYVRMATRPPMRRVLSNVRFGVSREIVDAKEKLVIGGNHRLRIIHPHAGRSIVIHKEGHRRSHFEREVSARTGAAAPVAPSFYGLEANGMAFVEEYLVGTPANRLALSDESEARKEAMHRLLTEVHRPSLRSVQLGEYALTLAAKIVGLAPEVGENACRLAEWASSKAGAAELGLVLSHGDFQAGNIHVLKEGLRIIDWETADERSQLYDIATFYSNIRQTIHKDEAWKRQVNMWIQDPTALKMLEVPPAGTAALLSHAAVWCLEEIVVDLELNRGDSIKVEAGNVVMKDMAEVRPHSDLALRCLVALCYLETKC